ncbi:MAG: hypothetical protein RLZZ612_590 [Pseudomonadota bacterium]|jgi:hypothetical protein
MNTYTQPYVMLLKSNYTPKMRCSEFSSFAVIDDGLYWDFTVVELPQPVWFNF